MPYFKYRIKETTTADVAIWGENEQDAMDKLDLYWIDNSGLIRVHMDKHVDFSSEMLAQIPEEELRRCDFVVPELKSDEDPNDIPETIKEDKKPEENTKPDHGRYPYGKERDNIYRIRINDEFGTPFCQDAAYQDFSKALRYISDGVKHAREEGNKYASAIIKSTSLDTVDDDARWWNVDVVFYKNGAPDLLKEKTIEEKPIKKTKIDAEPKHAVEEDGKKLFAYSTLQFTKKEAEDILAKLKKGIQTYGCVSWLDFANYSDHICNYVWNRHGWRNLDEAEIRPVDGKSDAYNIYFPKMIALDL